MSWRQFLILLIFLITIPNLVWGKEIEHKWDCLKGDFIIESIECENSLIDDWLIKRYDETLCIVTIRANNEFIFKENIGLFLDKYPYYNGTYYRRGGELYLINKTLWREGETEKIKTELKFSDLGEFVVHYFLKCANNESDEGSLVDEKKRYIECATPQIYYQFKTSKESYRNMFLVAIIAAMVGPITSIIMWYVSRKDIKKVEIIKKRKN